MTAPGNMTNSELAEQVLVMLERSRDPHATGKERMYARRRYQLFKAEVEQRAKAERDRKLARRYR